MEIRALNAFTDNYIWVFFLDKAKTQFACVDPGDAKPVMQYADKVGAELTHILITHHHYDHAGGIPKLQQAFPDVQIFAPDDMRISGTFGSVEEGDTCLVGKAKFKVFFTPGHTRTHICFYEPEKKWLFCGDTLFSGGCGRVFEGTHAELFNALQRLSLLPDDCKVFCGHEYTRQNLEFASQIAQENHEIQAYYKKIANQSCTLPSTIAIERKINLFMNPSQSEVIKFAKSQGVDTDDGLELFTLLRDKKDSF